MNHLLDYQLTQAFKHALYTYLASLILSVEESNKLMDIFRAIDVNSDGFLSFEEIKVGYCDHMGKVMTDQELKTFFK